MQLALRFDEESAAAPGYSEKKGIVYTREWVVNLILDLAGYSPPADLVSYRAVEPAAGEGAFFLPMVRRLLDSWKGTCLSPLALKDSLRGYEIDAASVSTLRSAVCNELVAAGISIDDAHNLAQNWVVRGDYLLDSPVTQAADFVIGNPPYIRHDDLSAELLAVYRNMYHTMQGRCDIYVAFFEAALRQLSQGGVCAFICADRWMRAAYGSELRKLVAESVSVEVVIEMHDAPAFEAEVSAYPAITILRRGQQRDVLVASAGPQSGPPPVGKGLARAVARLADKGGPAPRGFRAARLPAWYSGSAPWPWAEPEILDLLQHIESAHPPLEDPATGTRVGIGVATGADKVFITTDTGIVEPDRLLPLAMASDTRAGVVKWSEHYLIDPWLENGPLVDLRLYPKLRAYYEKHGDALRHRNVAARNPGDWYRTIDRVNHSLLRREKLYFPDMKAEANPVLDRGETYPHHNLYFIVSDGWDLEVLGGLLLSRVAKMFVAAYCVKMRGGTLRFQAQYLRRIHVPNPATIPPEVQSRLRAAFATRNCEAATEAAQIAYGIAALPPII